MRVLTLGRQPYAAVEAAMRRFTASRDAATEDEIWLVEHDPVYTQGLAGRDEHVLDPGAIPVVATNRGGQVTYHGPGQVVAYPLVDLARLGIYVKEFVYRLEHAALKLLEHHGVTGHRVRGAPGVYVRLADPRAHERLGSLSDGPARWQGLGKIAALGIKVSRGCTYHGVALNVAMDLRPFLGINPCGYAGLVAVDLATLGVHIDWASAAADFGETLAAQLGPRSEA